MRNEPWTLLWYASTGRLAELAEGCVAIARDACGQLICLDFNSPTIAVELFDPDTGNRCVIAHDFRAFVELWRP